MPNRLFISYRRKSWGFTHRLAADLSQRLDAEIFVDFSNIDEDDFERSILKHLRECDAVLLVVSEHTFADRIHRDDDWVRREIREALILNKPIVLIAVEGLYPPTGLPEDIKDIARKQGIAFYPEYFAAGVDRLAEFVEKIGAAQTKALNPLSPSEATTPEPADKPISGRASVDEALQLLEAHDYEKAIFLLETLRENGFSSRYINLDELLEFAREHQAQIERRRVAVLEYEDIVLLAARRFTEGQARRAWIAWCTDYPELVAELDTQNLHERLRPAPPKPKRSRVYDILPPPFEWVDIPAGQVTLEKGGYVPEGGQTFDVPAFAIAKYPITNAQYAKFIEAGGYNQRKWWTDAGWQWRESEKWIRPRFWQDAQWNGAEYPVVGVSWYECVAFCLWLREASGENIALPTEQQWQFAAQGDDERPYPWGYRFNKNRCNSSESRIVQTTPVMHYNGKGDSPFGVMDMAGNVWEWCSTSYDSGLNDLNISNIRYRVLRGGALNVTQYYVRAFSRIRNFPYFAPNNYGFRCIYS